ncbi:MAG: YceI family protein [Lysobacter sp.]
MFKQLASKAALVAALTTASAAAFAAPVTYQLDPAHTDVIAQWSHFGFSNPSMHFGQADGVLVYDADNVAASSVQVTLPLSSTNSFTVKFDQHLRSADFFDAAKFPTATFKSTKVEAAGEGKLKVTGELTIKDITKPVVLDVTLNKVGENMAKQPTIGFDAMTTIKRTDFGVGMYAPAVSDEVQIRITTEASVPKAAE